MADSSRRGRQRGSNAAHRHATSIWEWGVAAAGLAMILTIVGYLVYEALVARSDAPAITIEPVAVLSTGHNFVVRVAVRNSANVTAARLIIEGELRKDGETLESSEAMLDYLPGVSERHAGLIFERDPRNLDLLLRAKGYEEP